MSGGVDSSVAAWVLKQQGYNVIGATMQIWPENAAEGDAGEGSGCCGLSAAGDARRVADMIGIPHYVLNFREIFQRDVIDYFTREYLSGRTPNPCIACNRLVKWGALLRKARELGADCIATGHYARLSKYPETGRLTLARAKTLEKDQTYALYPLTQPQLRATLLPVGDYTKDEVRSLARELGLAVADKRESQEICFVSEAGYGKFIEQTSGGAGAEGFFLDESGKVIGRHRGVAHYTIGQRKGLGAFGRPMYVKKISAADNAITLADRDENLFSRGLTARDVVFMGAAELKTPAEALAKIRYSHAPARCLAWVDVTGVLRVEFEQPQRAVTPGQAIVIYRNECIICGGEIVRAVD
jgi:tRNA-specific 2-thiouridylase